MRGWLRGWLRGCLRGCLRCSLGCCLGARVFGTGDRLRGRLKIRGVLVRNICC